MGNLGATPSYPFLSRERVSQLAWGVGFTQLLHPFPTKSDSKGKDRDKTALMLLPKLWRWGALIVSPEKGGMSFLKVPFKIYQSKGETPKLLFWGRGVKFSPKIVIQ